MTGTAPNGDQFDKDKVLGRIKKMLALANDAAASEGERDNAMRMAHATLAKYGLHLAEAEKAGTGKQEQRIRGEFAIVGHAWARTCVQAIAELFFCKYVYVRLDQRFVKNYLIGRESNVETAVGMAEFVIENITREASRRRRDQGEDGGWERSFCKGAASRLYSRCWEIRSSAERADAPVDHLRAQGTAIVLASLYEQETKANEEVATRLFGKLESVGDRQKAAIPSAFQQGRKHADSISLNRQIGEKATEKKRLT